VGELSLDGTLRHVRGILPMAALARQEGYARMLVPEVDASEAALVNDIDVLPIPSLTALVNHLTEILPIAPMRVGETPQETILTEMGF
jgi:magnesium chelatase family protein